MAHQKATNAPTPRQLEVLRFVASFRRERGYSPTVKEICTQFGISSTNAVSDLLKGLMRRGLVHREPRTQRALTITDAGLRWVPGRAA
jgi:repressor LexA